MNSLIEITEKIARKYHADIEHAKEVINYSKMIFDALNLVSKNLNESDKKYLIAAAMLHDIGYFVEKKSHHKHSMDLILQENIECFSKEEILLVANIARYHRGSFPDEKLHENYSILSFEKRNLVLKLASILRLADGFDKPHKNLILRMRVENKEDELVFYLKSVGFKPSLKAANQKKELLEFVYNKKISFVIE